MTTRVNNRMIDGASVNVLDYGADPSQPDNTQAFSDAIATGKNIFIPEGTYTINPTLIGVNGFPLTSGQKILGTGAQTILDIQASARTSLFDLTDVSDVEIGWMKILGNSLGPFDHTFTSTTGLAYVCWGQSTVTNGCQRNTVHDIYLERSGGILATPYYQAGDSDPRFPQRNWHIYNNHVRFTTGHAVSGNFLNNTMVENNLFEDIGPACVDFSTAGANNVVQNNVCYRAEYFGKFQAQTAQSLRNYHANSLFLNNKAYNLKGVAGNKPLQMDGVGNAAIGNFMYCDETMTHGIGIEGDGKILDNVFRKPDTAPDANDRGIRQSDSVDYLQAFIDYGIEVPKIEIERNTISGYDKGIELGWVNSQGRTVVQYNKIDKCNIGIRASVNNDECKFSGNYINADGSRSPTTTGLIYLSDANSKDHTSITDNDIRCTDIGVVLSDSNGSMITGNTFDVGTAFVVINGTVKSFTHGNFGTGSTWPASSGDKIYLNNYIL